MADTISTFAAEIVLVAAAVAIYVAGACVDRAGLWRWVALAGFVGAAAALAVSPSGTAAGTPLGMDALGYYIRWLALGTGFLLTCTAWRPLTGAGTPEYVGSLVLAVAGTMLVAGARDLVVLFVALELVSIPTYIVLYLARRGAASQEAAAKYFFLSVLSSAMLLYGFSFLYGAAGSMDLGVIRDRLAGPSAASGGFDVFAKIALGLVLAGLGFRITAVPFHFYAPDVYQGTTHGNAAILSVLPKVAGLTALIRVVAAAMTGIEPYAWPAVMILAMLTMTLGNVLALWQDNVRRLMAYSSIAHAGYLLIGLTVALAPGTSASGAWDGIGAMLFYLLVYALATIGAFAALAGLGREEQQIDGVDELAGLAWSTGRVRPMMAWAIAVFMFSLTGIPPMAGFWGKLSLFTSALAVGRPETAEARPWLIALAVVGVLNSAISAAYYLRIVGVMFFRMPPAGPEVRERSGGGVFAALACAVLSLFIIGFHPGPWIGWADRSSPQSPGHRPPIGRMEGDRQPSEAMIEWSRLAPRGRGG
jgi:NADH-quinone oxidoreductase subunit N